MTYVLTVYYFSGRSKIYNLDINDHEAAQLASDFAHKLNYCAQFHNVINVISFSQVEEIILSKV